MRTLMNKKEYRVTFNRDFDGVIEGCSSVDGRYYANGAWLGEDIKEAYCKLNRLGYATSVEVWDKNDELVGGLYGVIMGECYIGESMFSRKPNTSKLALIHLARFMRKIGGKMIDCQLETPHLKSMGGRLIPYAEYLEILNPGALALLSNPESEPNQPSGEESQ